MKRLIALIVMLFLMLLAVALTGVANAEMTAAGIHRADQIKALSEKSVMWAVALALTSAILSSLAGKYKAGRIKLYYLEKIDKAEPSMEMPNAPSESALYHPYHLGMALMGRYTYGNVEPEEIAKNQSLANLCQGIIVWLIFRLIRKGYFKPVVRNGKPAGLEFTGKQPEDLHPEEETMLKTLQSAEGNGEGTLTAMSLKDAFTKPNGTIPMGIKLAAQLITAIHRRYTGPKPPYTGEPPIDMPKGIVIAALLETAMTSLMIASIVWGLLAGAIAWALWGIMGKLEVPPMVWAAAPAIVGLLVFILISSASKPDLGTWLHPQWWERFLEWERVASFIRNLPSVLDAVPTNTLNWDDYFEVASIRGLGEILTNTLSERRKDAEAEKLIAYKLSTTIGTYAFYHAYTSFLSGKTENTGRGEGH